MSNNNDYTTGNLLDFIYFKENHKLIATDLSKQTKLKDPQQIKNQKKLLLIFHTKFCHNQINNGNTKDGKFVKWF